VIRDFSEREDTGGIFPSPETDNSPVSPSCRPEAVGREDLRVKGVVILDSERSEEEGSQGGWGNSKPTTLPTLPVVVLRPQAVRISL